MLNQIRSLNMELGELVENAERSVVVIRSDGRGIGAGSIWQSDGQVVTNAHVIAHGNLEVSLLDGNVHPAKVLARDMDKDIAILRIDIHVLEMPHQPTFELGYSRDLAAEQQVMALGHPLGAQGAVSMGVITGVGPDLHEAPGGGQTELVARPLRRAVAGRLVGINTIMVGSNIGLAVPVTVVKKFLKDRLGTRKPEPEILASVL